MESKKKKAEIKKKKPWSTSIGWKGKMFGGVYPNKQWLLISLLSNEDSDFSYMGK